jgi:hypothetical protein
LSTNSYAPSTLQLTTGYDTQPVTVPRIATTEAFQTLGVYIMPSGSQTKQIEVLRLYAQHYHDHLQPAILTPSEAYWSYTLYLRPKLTYPLPCSSLTADRCHMIQAPALAALLPKLHLNCHSPRAMCMQAQNMGGCRYLIYIEIRDMASSPYLLVT